MGEIIFLENFVDNTLQLSLLLFVLFLFFGEPIIIAAAFFMSSHQHQDWLTLGVLAFVSAIIAELFWFYSGRIPYLRSFFLNKKMTTIKTFIEKIHLHKPLPLLFVTRLFTGLTIFAIIHLSTQGLSVRKFIVYSIIVNAFWTPLVVTIGYTAGLGYTYALNILNDVHRVSMLVLATALTVYLIYHMLNRHLLHKITAE